jgi:hypothetical protein
MNKWAMAKITAGFIKWFERKNGGDYSYEEAKLLEYYGYGKNGGHQLVSFCAGYKKAVKEKEKEIEKIKKDRLICGIAYTAGILNRYFDDQSATFLLKEAGIESIQELRDSGCDSTDIENLTGLLPERL